MMALSGFAKRDDKRIGGIKAIYMVDCNDVLRVEYDHATGRYLDVEMRSQDSLRHYEIREGEALYRQTVTMINAMIVVEHRLSLLLGRMGEQSARAIEELCATSRSGLIAFVETMSGDRFLVGYSPKFGLERPLRVISGVGTSGQQFDDDSNECIVLLSEDTQKARLHMGAITFRT